VDGKRTREGGDVRGDNVADGGSRGAVEEIFLPLYVLATPVTIFM